MLYPSDCWLQISLAHNKSWYWFDGKYSYLIPTRDHKVEWLLFICFWGFSLENHFSKNVTVTHFNRGITKLELFKYSSNYHVFLYIFLFCLCFVWFCFGLFCINIIFRFCLCFNVYFNYFISQRGLKEFQMSRFHLHEKSVCLSFIQYWCVCSLNRFVVSFRLSRFLYLLRFLR